MAQQNSNNTENKRVNTEGTMFYVKRELGGHTGMEVAYWADMISFNIKEALPEKGYSKDDYAKVLITTEQSTALVDIYDTYIKPAIVSREMVRMSVAVKRINLVELSSGMDNLDKSGNPVPYFSIVLGMDSSTRIPENMKMYEFHPIEAIEGYDPTTGEFKGAKSLYASLDAFINILRNHAVASSNVYTHSERDINGYYKKQVTDNQQAIGAKLGIDLKPRQNYSNGTQGSLFDRSAGNSAPEENLGSLDMI